MWFEAGTKRQKFHDRTTADTNLSRVSFLLNEKEKKKCKFVNRILKKVFDCLGLLKDESGNKHSHAFTVHRRDYTFNFDPCLESACQALYLAYLHVTYLRTFYYTREFLETFQKHLPQ